MTIATQTDANTRTLALLEGRLRSLEARFENVSEDRHGTKLFLKGEPGSIEDATAAAQKLMAEELNSHRQVFAEAVAEVQKQQNNFFLEIAQEFNSLKATALSVLERSVRETVRQLLVAANIIQEDGSRHPSMKGEPSFIPGPPSTVPGPQGPQGIPGPGKEAVEQVIREIIGTLGDETLKKHVALKQEIDLIAEDSRYGRINPARREIVDRLYKHL